MKRSSIARHTFCAWIFAALLVFTGAGINHLNGQSATATVQGTVTDMSGAAIPDAAVQLKNTGTGASRTVNTDAQGRYRASDLQVGGYDVSASKNGFSTVAHSGITLNVGAEVVVDFCDAGRPADADGNGGGAGYAGGNHLGRRCNPDRSAPDEGSAAEWP